MHGFKVNTVVDVHDVDYNGIAKTSSIMRYLQTAAQCQLTDGGLSYDNLKKMNRVFVLSRFKLEVNEPLYAYTPLTAVTFPCESRGFGFVRCYALLKENVTVARAISVWGLIDTESRALVPVDRMKLGLTLLPPIDMRFEHFKLPSSLTDIGGYGVHYGDVDQNMHMNNTKYPDMYSNYLPLKGKMIKSVSINYINEATFGEKLRVQRALENDTYYFRTIRSDEKANSGAKIELSDIG